MPRQQISYRTASKENYKIFCELHPDITLPFSEWQNIIYSFNYAFRDYMLETGNRAKMPWGFGDFMVSKKKKKREKVLPDGRIKINLSVNWKATKEAGKKIYHTNLHTSGYNFYWRWEPKTARIPYSDIWYFKPSRETSRLITHYLTKYPDMQYQYAVWGK